MLNRIIKESRSVSEEKVGFSLQIPKSLKQNFEKYCKDSNTTMTATLVSFMKYAIDVENGLINEGLNATPTSVSDTVVSSLKLSRKLLLEDIEKLEASNMDNEMKATEINNIQEEIKKIDEALRYVT